ncbi:MAG: ABC transporter permease [Firmicutes bacterium]|nr:ABC transporter permease [Bacillota bacterium]
MLSYVLKRLLMSLATLFIVVTIVFCLLRLMPVEGFLGPDFEKLDPAQQQAILDSAGLLDPLPVQLRNFFAGLLQGDLGTSTLYRPQVPVRDIIGPKIPYSLALGLVSVMISVLAGISLAVLMVRFKGGIWDKVGTTYIVVINAVPAAVYYLFLQLYATEWINVPVLFDVSRPASWILPVFSMALGSTAGYALWMRRYMVDELSKDYIRLARAKGFSSGKIMVKHVLRNAFVPMAQYLPMSILLVIGGSLYIESLYSIPGMGGLLVNAIKAQDTPLVQTLVLIYAGLSIFGLFLGDVLMALFDPRIQLDGKGGDNQ